MAYTGGVYEVARPTLVVNLYELGLSLLVVVVLGVFAYYFLRYYVSQLRDYAITLVDIMGGARG